MRAIDIVVVAGLRRALRVGSGASVTEVALVAAHRSLRLFPSSTCMLEVFTVRLHGRAATSGANASLPSGSFDHSFWYRFPLTMDTCVA